MKIRIRTGSGTLLKLACYVSLMISFLPIVDYYCDWYITAIPFALVLLITLMRNRDVKDLLIGVLLILAFSFLNYWIVRRADFLNYFINAVMTFLPFISAIQIGRTEEDPTFFRNYLRMVALLMGITAITTIVGLNEYPMASRELASGTAIYDTTKYTRANIGGFDFIYALVIFVPVLLWMIKNSKGLWKIILIIVLVLDILCVYESQYTIAIICVAIGLLAVWMQHDRKRAGIVTAILLAFVAFGGLTLIGNLFYWLSSVTEQPYVADRFLQVAQLLTGQTVKTDTSTERIDHYYDQFAAFASSPIWGHNLVVYDKSYVSGHSLVLDILGGAGLLGMAALFAIVRKMYTTVVNPSRTAVSSYVRAMWTTLIVVSVLNPVLFSSIVTIAFMCGMCIQKSVN